MHAISKYGLKRILIVDWDLHHGNGTQHSFTGIRDLYSPLINILIIPEQEVCRNLVREKEKATPSMFLYGKVQVILPS